MNRELRSLVPWLLTLSATSAALPAQMEKRGEALYDREAFRADAPAVGSQAPDLVLCDLDGRLQALSAYRGRVVVIIKAGFT